MNRIDQYQTPSSETFRDPETIENQISNTRNRMDNTIEKLGDKLDPREYLSAAGDWAERHLGNFELGDVTAKCSSFGNRIATGIKENPVPTALIGTAAIMLLIPKRSKGDKGQSNDTGQNSRPLNYNDPHMNTEAKTQSAATNPYTQSSNGNGSDDGNRVWDSISEIPDKASALAKSASHVVAEKTKAGGEAITSTSKNLARKTGETARESKQRFERSTQESPGIVGAGALALGFLAAVALPRTRKENEFCGEASDELKSRIKKQIDDSTPSIKDLKKSSIEAVDSLGDQACEKVDETIAPETN